MEIELTRLFVRVVQNGSYTKAAEILKVPKSTVSKAVSRLEAETGTKLLLRTTRSQTLTAAGRSFYETCLGPLQVLEDAQKSLYGQESIVSGMIKLTAPEDLGTYVIAPAIAELSRRHSQLFFDLQYTNHVVDLIKEGFDLAVRIGHLSESRLKVRKLGEVHLIAVASPDYLKNRDRIRSPKDLEKQDCLHIAGTSLHKSWELRSKKEKSRVTVRSRIESNHVTSLLQMTLAGAGVAFLPYYLCKSDIETGNLVRLLPDWKGEALPVSLASPLSSNTSARLKMVSEAITNVVREALS